MAQRKEFRNSKTFSSPSPVVHPEVVHPQGPPGYCQRRVIHEDDQRTLWYTNGPLELIQLEEVLEPATHPQ